MPGGGTITLAQTGCSGTTSTHDWNFTVAGNVVTIDNGITGTVSASGSSTTIVFSNGFTYTKAALPSTCEAWSGAHTSCSGSSMQVVSFDPTDSCKTGSWR